MGNGIEVVAGLFLIGFAFIIFLYAMPSLSGTFNTAPGGTFENGTATFKAGIDVTHDLLIIFPFMFLFSGLFLTLKGVGK